MFFIPLFLFLFISFHTLMMELHLFKGVKQDITNCLRSVSSQGFACRIMKWGNNVLMMLRVVLEVWVSSKGSSFICRASGMDRPGRCKLLFNLDDRSSGICWPSGPSKCWALSSSRIVTHGINWQVFKVKKEGRKGYGMKKEINKLSFRGLYCQSFYDLGNHKERCCSTM